MEWKKEIRKVGNSLAVLIPIELAKYVNIKKGDKVIMQDDKGKYGKFISFWSERQKEQIQNNL